MSNAFKAVDYRAGVQLLGLDTFTPAGIYFRPFPEGEVPAHLVGQALPGDFFLITKNPAGALRADLLPWSAPVEGNCYPEGDHGVAGSRFDPRGLAGPWVPFRPVPLTESVTGSYIGAEHFERVTGDLRGQVLEAQRLLEEAGQLVGLLVGLQERGAVQLNATAAQEAEEMRRRLSVEVEAWIRDARLRRAMSNLEPDPTFTPAEVLP